MDIISSEGEFRVKSTWAIKQSLVTALAGPRVREGRELDDKVDLMRADRAKELVTELKLMLHFSWFNEWHFETSYMCNLTLQFISIWRIDQYMIYFYYSKLATGYMYIH